MDEHALAITLISERTHAVCMTLAFMAFLSKLESIWARHGSTVFDKLQSVGGSKSKQY
jgi:hypothetical protein